MHRAGLAEKPRPESLAKPVRLQQDLQKALDIFAIVRRVDDVLLEWNGVRNLVGHRVDAHREIEPLELARDPMVEICNGHRRKGEAAPFAGAHFDAEFVGDEIEIY